jgi:diketogulonate reductase-like aldo/keto reductase
MDASSTRALASGKQMPVIGLGTWQLTDDTAGAVQTALKLGYRMIDTSGDYGTEPGIAEGLKRSGVAREEVYIVTKIEPDEDAYQSTVKNLKQLDMVYADLVLIHKPPKEGVGEGLWEGLRRDKREGLAKDIGVSSYSIPKIKELFNKSGEMPVVNQIEWSPFGHSQEMLEFCQQNKIIIQAFSSLTRNQKIDDPTLAEVAEKYKKQPAQILLRWNLQLGTVPIAKANKREHQEANLDIFDFEISGDDMATLNGLNENFSTFDSPLPYV